MKKILLVPALLLSLATLAQEKSEGRIVYEETITMEYNFKGREGMEGMENKMPKTRTFKKELLFSADATIYQDTLGPDEQVPESDKNHWRKMWRGEDITYTNLKTGKTTQQKDFMSKKFLIKSEKEELKWKLTGETKVIKGYSCFKADLQDTSRSVSAWFTTEIPVSSGPHGAGQLPGMIMEMSMRDGKLIVTATVIEFKTLKEGTLEEPDKGKEVTEEEFEQIREDKRKEMREMYGEGGGRHGMHGGHH